MARGVAPRGSFGDGWLASGYNTTQVLRGVVGETLSEMLEAEGAIRYRLPSTMAATWLYVTDDEAENESHLRHGSTQMVRRPVEDLVGRLPGRLTGGSVP